MQYVDVKGARIPALGMGTWKLQGDACREAVELALELGYRRFDTAQMYDNEASVGGALRASNVDRDELWVTTKIAPDNAGRDDVLRSARESVRRLALERVDLLLIHWPSPDVPLEETLQAMQELQSEGLTRHLGVSNFPPKMLDDARHIAPLLSVQVEYHPYLSQEHLRKQAEAFDMMLTAYCPLARGKVTEDRVLREIGDRHGKSAAQVALRWLIQQRNVSAIPKAGNEAHLRANLDIFDFELSEREMLRIGELECGERLIDPEWAPRWNQL